MRKFLNGLLAISLITNTILTTSVFGADNNISQPKLLTESGKVIMPSEIIYYKSGDAPRPTTTTFDKTRSFVKTYTKKINSNSITEIMYDSNSFLNDDTIRVSLIDDGKNGTQDVEFTIFEYSPFGDKGYNYTLSKGQGTGACQIATGNNFSIFAKYQNSTTDGNIEIEVSLQSY